MFENEITLEGYEYTEDIQGLFELIKSALTRFPCAVSSVTLMTI